MALSDVSLTMSTGEVFGFIRLTGAGKEFVLGRNASDEFSEMGRVVDVVLDMHGLCWGLSAFQNLLLFGELLRTTGLWSRRHGRVAAHSKGMKQRLAITRSLMNHPKSLIMDEPISGPDPYSRRTTEDLIKQLTESRNFTVLLSSHSLADAE